MVQGWTQVDMVAFANPTLEKLNRIQVLPNTRKGRRAILETAEGIGHCPRRPREKHPQQDNKEQQDEEWFARFTDDYDGANPMFLMYIQDQPLRCLLDTGASVNLIGDRALEATRKQQTHQLHPTTTRARDVQGRPVQLSGKIQITTTFGGKPHRVEFEVVTNSDTLIMGNPFIYSNDLQIIGREGFGTRHSNVPQAKKPRQVTYRIYAAQDTLLQPDTYTKTTARIISQKRTWAQDVNRVFLAGADDEDNGLHMEPTLSALDKQGQLMVLTANKSPIEYTLEEGTYLGTATSDYDDGERVVAAVMAEMSDIQRTVNHIPTHHIINGPNNINRQEMEVMPPGFDIQGPQPPTAEPSTGKFDTQRENEGATPETAHILMDDPIERERIRDLLRKHRKIFSQHNYDIGHFVIDGQVQKVKLTLSDTTPIVEQYRSMSPAKKEAAEQIIQQLEKYKIITRKASGWASQAVWVAKALPELTPQRAKELGIPFVPGTKDHQAKRNLRFTTDFRALNERLQSVQWPLPPIKNILARLRGTKYVTVLDASHSFYCIELDDQSKLYTGFQTCEKNFVMERLAMGLKCSSGILNACLAKTLATCEDITIPYSDNILVISKTAKDHTRDVGKVLQTLQNHGWKFKMAKCHWGVHDALKIFGMEVSLKQGTIGPDPDKAKSLRDTPRPTTIKQLKSFLGGIGYFVECMPDIGGQLARLHGLTKPKDKTHKETIQWDTEDRQAFQDIITALGEANKINMPRWDRPMHLVCDAGPQHVASMLCQIDDNQQWTPLGFYTKKLSTAECNLSQIEKECLAIIYGTRQTAHYISHTKVYIHSDSQPFVLLKKHHSHNTKLARWKMHLESFDHSLVWQSSNTPAISFVDFLSRPPTKKLVNKQITQQDIEALPNRVPEGIYEPPEYNKLLEEIISHHDSNQEPAQTTTPQAINTIASAAATSTPSHATWEKQEMSIRMAKLARNQTLTLGEPSRPTAVGSQTTTPEAALIEIVLTDCPFLNLQQLRELQKECSVLGKIYKNVDQYPDFTIHDGILLKKFTFKEIHRILLAVPVTLADDLVSDIHRGSTAHAGKKKLIQMIRTRYFIPQLRKRAEKTVDNCGLCGYFKPRLCGGKRPAAKTMTPRGPGDVWTFDKIQIVSTPDEDDRTSLLCFVDLYSHFVVARPVTKASTAAQVADIFLSDVVSRFGVPRAILSDNSNDMDSDLFRETANLLGITKLTISPNSPRGNGICEKVQGLILTAIRHQAAQYRVKPKMFADLAVWAVLAVNAQPFQNMEPPLSPAEIFLGRSIAESSFFGFANASYTYHNLEEFNKRMVAAQMSIAEIIGAKTRYLSEIKEKQRLLDAPHWSMKPGTIVAMKDKTQARQNTNIKLRPRYRGAYIVVKEMKTACLIRPYSSESILEDMETEEEVPRGRGRRLPRYKIIKVDKDDLKKTKHLLFYSQPMARKFLEHLVTPAPQPGQTYDVVEDSTAEPTLEQDPEDRVTTFNADESEPPNKIRKISVDGGAFEFEEE